MEIKEDKKVKEVQKLFRFEYYCDCIDSDDEYVESIFIATQKEISSLIGEEFYKSVFRGCKEVEIWFFFRKEMFTVLSEEEDKIKWLKSVSLGEDGHTIFGESLFDR